MRYVLMVLCTVLLWGIGQAPAAVGGQNGRQLAQQAPREPDATFKERSAKRRKYIACYESGKGECYEKFSESVRWCQDNWEKCFPLIPGIGAHAAAYGKQELEKCKAQLRIKCRREAGL